MEHRFRHAVSKKKLNSFYRNPQNFSWTLENFERYVEWASIRKVERIKAWVARLAPADMLDVGCGSGILLNELKPVVPSITGCDLSDVLLQRVRKEKKIEQLVAADLKSLPFASNSFQSLLCSEVLEHLPNPKRAIQEIARVLKPGGKALITTPHLHCYDGLEGKTQCISRAIAWTNRVRRLLHRPPIYPYGYNTHLVKLSPSQWQNLFSPPFSLMAMEPIFIFPYFPAGIPPLKKIEQWLVPKIFNAQGKMESALKKFYPFSHLGQLQLYVLEKRSL